MKKLFFVVLFLCCAGAAGFFYVWRQATHLPEWYATPSSETQRTRRPSDSHQAIGTRTQLQKKVEASIAHSQKTSPSEKIEVELSEREIDELVTTLITQQVEKKPVFATIRDNKTTIKDGIIESGAVINLGDLPQNQLSSGERDALDKVLTTFPFLGNKEIYVEISGKPHLNQGQLQWDNSTKFKIGNLSLSLRELSELLGIPPEKISQKLTPSLSLGRLNVNDMEFTENKVLLRGSVDSVAR